MFPRFLDGLRIFLTFTNIVLLFSVIVNTGISLRSLGIILLIYIILGIILFRLIKKDWFLIFAKFDYFGLLLPTIFNGFFLINYLFSGDTYTEKYRFDRLSSKELANSPTIILENNAYQEFYFFRTFVQNPPSITTNVVTYHFAEGFFGLKVMKGYDFSQENLNFEQN